MSEHWGLIKTVAERGARELCEACGEGCAAKLAVLLYCNVLPRVRGGMCVVCVSEERLSRGALFTRNVVHEGKLMLWRELRVQQSLAVAQKVGSDTL